MSACLGHEGTAVCSIWFYLWVGSGGFCHSPTALPDSWPWEKDVQLRLNQDRGQELSRETFIGQRKSQILTRRAFGDCFVGMLLVAADKDHYIPGLSKEGNLLIQ